MTWPGCSVRMRNKGPNLLEVSELARAPVGGGGAVPTISDCLPLVCEFSESRTLSYSNLYAPMCLRHLGAQQILVECAWTNKF